MLQHSHGDGKLYQWMPHITSGNVGELPDSRSHRFFSVLKVPLANVATIQCFEWEQTLPVDEWEQMNETYVVAHYATRSCTESHVVHRCADRSVLGSLLPT
jgi:hypothetical protein